MNKNDFSLNMGIDLTRNSGVYDLVFNYQDSNGTHYTTNHQGSDTNKLLDEFQNTVISHLVGTMLKDNAQKNETKNRKPSLFAFDEFFLTPSPFSFTNTMDEEEEEENGSPVAAMCEEEEDLKAVQKNEDSFTDDLYTSVRDLAAQVEALDKRITNLYRDEDIKLENLVRRVFTK
jgi:predicted heme/steroid binding protein